MLKGRNRFAFISFNVELDSVRSYCEMSLKSEEFKSIKERNNSHKYCVDIKNVVCVKKAN